jgi:hypothetical protein
MNKKNVSVYRREEKSMKSLQLAFVAFHVQDFILFRWLLVRHFQFYENFLTQISSMKNNKSAQLSLRSRIDVFIFDESVENFQFVLMYLITSAG